MCLHSFFFFFNGAATTEIYTLSLHDALPILFFGLFEGGFEGLGLRGGLAFAGFAAGVAAFGVEGGGADAGEEEGDRKSTRLNSSHSQNSYAVFCLKKKKKQVNGRPTPACHSA